MLDQTIRSAFGLTQNILNAWIGKSAFSGLRLLVQQAQYNLLKEAMTFLRAATQVPLLEFCSCSQHNTLLKKVWCYNIKTMIRKIFFPSCSSGPWEKSSQNYPLPLCPWPKYLLKKHSAAMGCIHSPNPQKAMRSFRNCHCNYVLFHVSSKQQQLLHQLYFQEVQRHCKECKEEAGLASKYQAPIKMPALNTLCSQLQNLVHLSYAILTMSDSWIMAGCLDIWLRL